VQRKLGARRSELRRDDRRSRSQRGEQIHSRNIPR
jgi:hypothetical protein